MAYYDNYLKRSKKVTKLGLFHVNRSNHELIKSITSMKPNTTSILEIGGGKGEFAKWVTSNRIRYTGIEPNLALADKLSNYGKIYKCSVPPYPKLNRKFDVIFSSNVIEHIELKDLYKIISESKKILKKDGFLILKFPNYLDMDKYFWDCDYTHVFPTTKKRVTQLLNDSEFQVTKIQVTRLSFESYFLRLFLFFLNRMLKYIFLFIDEEKIYKAYLSSSEQITIFARPINNE